ncbi:MAG: HU family DNA-binding protein [Candidatus Nealsonbacteria bacterium]|nr:HU family DNA-binding protein [Candidatus Nealsonbacteria bacterium]
MTKDDINQAISRKTGLSKRQAGDCLQVILDEIAKSLSKGESVLLPGFGKFVVKDRKERQGVNPKTGEKIKIPAAKVPKFKPGQTLKDAVK